MAIYLKRNKIKNLIQKKKKNLILQLPLPPLKSVMVPWPLAAALDSTWGKHGGKFHCRVLLQSELGANILKLRDLT